MVYRKVLHVLVTMMLVLISILPSHLAMANMNGISTKGDIPVDWPTTFSPYTKSDGHALLDPGSDVHPIDVDITSGVGRGKGALPSMLVASDGKHFFVRLRLKGDPYDRKGGFLSSVWLVQLAVSGVHKATIGLNGKSPSVDYVYVANADGSVTQPIYATSSETGNSVPGTRIVEAENGQYFLDFQVPISRITEVASDVTADTTVQLFFGTSKAANLSVINKEFMDTDSNNGSNVNFLGLSEIKLIDQPVSVSIDGGTSKSYSTTNKVMSGTTSITNGQVSISINKGTSNTASVSNHVWSYLLPDDIVKTNGNYLATVTAASDGKSASAQQDIMVEGNTDTLTINGGAIASTSVSNPTISGTFASTTNRNNFTINLYVSETSGSPGASVKTTTTDTTWSKQITLNNPIKDKIYYLTAEWIENGGNKTPYAVTKQQLTFVQGVSIQPIEVAISSVSGEAQPIITGTSTGANRIEVRIDGVSTEFVTPSSDGSWSLSALEKPLSTGTHTITAIASNSSGNTATASKTHSVTTTTITIDNGNSVAINDHTPTLRGDTNAADGTTVKVSIGNAGTFTTVAKNNRWTIEVPDSNPISDGTYTVTATVNNVNATQSLTIDTGTEVYIESPVEGYQTTHSNLSFSGKAEASSSVSLRLEKATGEVLWVENLLADGSGNWSFQSSKIARGDYSIKVTAADVYGNEDTAESHFSIIENQEPNSIQIESVEEFRTAVDYGTSLSDVRASLPTKVNVHLSDKTIRTMDVIWSEDANPVFNGTNPGTYDFSGTLINLPDNVVNSSQLKARAVVTVNPLPLKSGKDILTFSFEGYQATPSINMETHVVNIELPFGTDVSHLVADFVLTDAASASVEGIVQQSGGTANNYNQSLVYTITAEDGTKQDWTVSIQLSEQGVSSQPVVVSPIPLREGANRLIGTAESGAVITIKNGDILLGTVVTNEQGKWEFEVLPLLKDQILSITSKSGNKKESSALNITVLEKLKTVQSYDERTVYVFKNTDSNDVKQLLGSMIGVTLDSREKDSLPVEWILEGAHLNEAGNYILQGTIGSLPSNIVNPNQLQPTATLMVIDHFEIRGSDNGEKTVMITGAFPGGIVNLYDPDGHSVKAVQADTEGSVTFSNVRIGEGYYATQTIGSLVSPNSVRVNVTARQVEPLIIKGSMDGAKTINVTNAQPGAIVNLYNKTGALIQTKPADTSGTIEFKNVPTDINYVATQIVDGDETQPSAKVNVYPKIQIRFSEGDIWESVTKSVFLIDQLLDTKVKWTSSNAQVLNIANAPTINEGSSVQEYVVNVNRQAEDTSVILTAELLFDGKLVQRTFLLVVKGNHYNTEKMTVVSSNPVKLGDQLFTQDIQVNRTTLDDRTNQQQFVDKLIISESANLGSGNVFLQFGDTPQTGVKADEQAVEMPVEALRKLSGDLTIATPEGTFSLPRTSIAGMTDAGLDLFFRIVPMRSEEQKQEVIQRTQDSMQTAAGSNKTIQVLDIPREIETNYSGYNTDIILPLRGMNLTAEHADDLRLLIEHTNGTEEVIEPGVNGEIIYKNGVPDGLKFTISHFSTFTFFTISNVTPTPTPNSGVNVVEKLTHKKYISGFKDGNFRPEADVTRAQMAAMISRILTDWNVPIATRYSYPDTVDTFWARNDIEYVRSEKIIFGYSNGKFGPSDSITRAQMAVITMRWIDQQCSRDSQFASFCLTSKETNTYKDVQPNYWAAKEIERIGKTGIMTGFTNGTFHPDEKLTRAQAVKVLNQLFHRGPLEGVSQPSFLDVSSNYWAFKDIEEAATIHFYELRDGNEFLIK